MAKKKAKIKIAVAEKASPAEVRTSLDVLLRHVQQDNKDAKVVSERLKQALLVAGEANDVGAVEGLAAALAELQAAWDAEPDEEDA
jgi:hypothetical protein